MGSPLSTTIEEIYLQYFEELVIKHWIETSEIIYDKDMLMTLSLYLTNIKPQKTQSPNT